MRRHIQCQVREDAPWPSTTTTSSFPTLKTAQENTPPAVEGSHTQDILQDTNLISLIDQHLGLERPIALGNSMSTTTSAGRRSHDDDDDDPPKTPPKAQSPVAISPASRPTSTGSQTTTPASTQATDRRNTRARAASGEPDIAGLVKTAAAQAVMRSGVTARRFLGTKGYLAEGQTVTLSGLAQVLMCLSQASAQVPAIVKEGMLAVAKLLQVHEQVEITAEATNRTNEGIHSTVKLLNEQLNMCTDEVHDAANMLTVGVVKNLKKLDEDLATKATDFVARLDEEITSRTDNLMMDIRKEAADIVAQAREAVTLQQQQQQQQQSFQPCLCSRPHPHDRLDRTQDHDHQGGGSQGEDGEHHADVVPPPGPGTYRDVVQNGATHSATPSSQLAGEQVNARQKLVYVDLQDTTKAEEIRQLTEEDLVKKANITLVLMGIFALDRPQGTAFMAAKKQKNGGILFELNSVESAKWLKAADTRVHFSYAFDEGATVQGSAYPCLLKFVPVAYQTNNRDEREEVEAAARLPLGTLSDTRWMKPPGRRELSQKYAHLIVRFPSPETANAAIRHGLYIRGAKVKSVQLFPEPLRCHKCSLYANHKAADCQSKEQCGKCGREHKTQLCTARLAEDLYCVNCKQRGHGAVSRDCPTYWLKKKRMDSRNPATRFKYVVISTDPSSWEPAEEEPPPPPPTPSPPYRNSWKGPPKPRRHADDATPDITPTTSQRTPSGNTNTMRQSTLDGMVAGTTGNNGTPQLDGTATSTVANV